MSKASRPARQLWSMKAEKMFGLQRLPDEEHTPARQAAWQAYVKDRTEAESNQKWLQDLQAAIKKGDCDSDVHGILYDSGKPITDVVPQGVSAVLAAASNLTDEDRAALQACVMVTEADCFDDGEDHMRSSTFTTRLYSPVSTAAVDLCLSDLYKVRYSWNGLEYATDVSYALADAAKTLHKAQQGRRSAWKGLYSLSNYDDDPRLDPDDMEWFYQPEPRLHLTPQKLKQIRQHLFGDAAAGLSSRLSDCELVQLLVVSSGSQWNEYRGDGESMRLYRDKAAWTQLSPHGWDISKDGWLEHRVREMCNELRAEDAKWKPQDTEQKVLEHIMRWAKEKRSEAVRDQIKKRIDEGRFTREAFKEDGAPEGYYDTVSGNDDDY